MFDDIVRPDVTKHGRFPLGYIDEVFTAWYSLGKPSSRLLAPKLKPCEVVGKRPSDDVLEIWINRDFKKRAELLDGQVLAQINERMVAEKVEMLNRHANLGTEVQDIALKYINEHREDLNVSNAVRLLVEGVRIERESRGISTTIEKITNQSDEELQRQIEQLVTNHPVEFLPMEVLDADIEHEQEDDS
jgi:hypothetical protein